MQSYTQLLGGTRANFAVSVAQRDRDGKIAQYHFRSDHDMARNGLGKLLYHDGFRSQNENHHDTGEKIQSI
jgi:hypothetical protein